MKAFRTLFLVLAVVMPLAGATELQYTGAAFVHGDPGGNAD